jgi:6,7-dimethyl-8-ribityllumazine synthase
MNRIALLMGSFHEREIALMRDAALDEAAKLGLTVVEELCVPGSMEKPLGLRWLLKAEQVDGVAILGIIERGETKHGLVMAQSVINALIAIQQEFDKPIGVGILGPEIQPSQIPPRLESYARSSIKAVKAMLDIKTRLLGG